MSQPASQRAPMSEEKKKAAAEKRKVTVETNKKKEAEKRVEDSRKTRITDYCERIASLHDQRMAQFEERRQQLIKECAEEDEWFEKQKKYHAKYCAALVNADLPDELIKAINSPHDGHVSTSVIRMMRTYQSTDEIKIKYMASLSLIDGISNITVESYLVYGTTHFRVGFDISL